MRGQRDWKRDIRDGVRQEGWALSGPNCPIKVRPLDAPTVHAVSGYFTLGKFLVGKTPGQIERDLGLKRGGLAKGARIWRFARLPQISEYNYELTALYPDGLSYNPSHFDPDYGPGKSSIHQWCIKPNVMLPVHLRPIDLGPGERLSYGAL